MPLSYITNNSSIESVYRSLLVHFVMSQLGLIYANKSIIHKYFEIQMEMVKVSKGAKIRSRYNQVPHLTQDTNGKFTNSQLDTTNESEEVSPFPAGDHKAQLNRRAQINSKHKTEQKHKRSTKKYGLGTVSKISDWRA